LSENLALKLRTRLMEIVNGKISEKARDRLGVKEYFALRVQKEKKIILDSGFAFDFFEREATLEEIENLDVSARTIEGIAVDKTTLMLCTIQALKSYVGSEDLENPKCEALHGLFLKLKEDLNPEVAFEYEGDDFLAYLDEKELRRQKEEARVMGSVCVFCGSEDVHSYGSMWKCSKCGKHFRKHKG
jgi:hypothetical protein